jgi:integrase
VETRTKGIQIDKVGNRVVNKQYRGKRLFERLGKVSQEEAEIWLRQQQARIDLELSRSATRNFATAAGQYLTDCEKRSVRTLELIAYHVKLVLPFIGTLPLEAVHSGSLQSFIDSRLDDDKVSPTTVNRSLEVVRSILTKAARVWRNDDGTAWLGTAPLIEMLDTKATERLPHPITWEEQRTLVQELPCHLQPMILFAVNTGLRDDNICGLKWSWERYIPELKRSVFIVPAAEFKGNRPHVAILNDAAWNIIEKKRGEHTEYVFTYENERNKQPRNRIDSINNTAWQKARARAKLEQVRVHDLRHTFGQRLRDTGVSPEDRAALMGHATSNMTEHYATPTIARLIEMANRVTLAKDSATLLRLVREASK